MICEVVTPQIGFAKSFGKCLTDHEGNKKREEKSLKEKTDMLMLMVFESNNFVFIFHKKYILV